MEFLMKDLWSVRYIICARMFFQLWNRIAVIDLREEVYWVYDIEHLLFGCISGAFGVLKRLRAWHVQIDEVWKKRWEPKKYGIATVNISGMQMREFSLKISEEMVIYQQVLNELESITMFCRNWSMHFFCFSRIYDFCFRLILAVACTSRNQSWWKFIWKLRWICHFFALKRTES